jgi:hypothetical protein
MVRMIVILMGVFLLNSFKAASQLNLRAPIDTINKRVTLRVLPQNFYNQQLGYFCKKELQVQKAVALPLYFRLGSKDYVDYLEQKPNAIKRF